MLLDECVPKKLRRDLPAHEVRTVTEMGWAGTRNGPLLRQAVAEFDVFLTVDQGIEFQQSLTGLALAVIVMAAATNDIDERAAQPNGQRLRRTCRRPRGANAKNAVRQFVDLRRPFFARSRT